ncbi:unnamed protein product [Lactuca saligna]|uniref:Arabidopsis retrotransposon Orf1 C-terminal domain-containing protein n=1 Tax=Lactuca saligna TaxID=75948 RepID=A0AA35V6N7_LACSI|nr:unnamed protein product [Lactuca saligna]
MEATSSKRPRQTKSSTRRRKPRSPSPPSRSPSPPSRSPTPPADPSHFGVVCLGPVQQGKLESFLKRGHAIQKFAHVPTLKELHVYNQVKTMFRNIWWHGLLRVHELSYKVPTAKFLSSVYLDHGILYFRLMNQDYEISLDQINAIVGAPTENTFGPTDPIQGYYNMTWWTQLTQLHPYVSSAAKASSLIHPVIKVAHRIIASLVAPREERSTISALELKILYAMTHPENNLIPHYGRFLYHKLIRLSASRSGKIVCGGIVSMLAKSAHIRAPYPGPHQPLSGEPYLTTTVLESMRLFRSAGDGTHHWTVGQNHDPKLLITPENKGILDFRNPIHMTDWKIIPYIFPQSYYTEVDEQSEENEEDGDDDEEEEEPHHASPTGGGSSSHFAAPPPYHQQYMDEFQSIHTRLDTYQQDITSLTQNFSTFTTQYARDQERQCKHEEDFWAWTRNPSYYPPPPPPF